MSDTHYEPTAAEIAAACEAIQAEWSDAERERRHIGGRVVAWTVPTATITGIRASAAENRPHRLSRATS